MSEIKTTLVPVEELTWVKKIQPYTKFILACVSAVGVSTVVGFFEGGVTPTTAVTAIVALLGAISIYAAPNAPKAGTTLVETSKGDTVAVIPAASEVYVVDDGTTQASIIVPTGVSPDSFSLNGGK